MPNDALSKSRRRSKLGLSSQQVSVSLRLASTSLSVASLAACSASPSRNILGSYFPTWMICALLGLAGVVVLRFVFGKTGIDAALPIPVVVYLCAWLAVTLAIWLIWLA
jgi:hypothetical protein